MDTLARNGSKYMQFRNKKVANVIDLKPSKHP